MRVCIIALFPVQFSADSTRLFHNAYYVINQIANGPARWKDIPMDLQSDFPANTVAFSTKELEVTDEIEYIEKKMTQLRARKLDLQSKKDLKDRKARSRRAHVLGEWLIANAPDAVEKIKLKLDNAKDRRAFGLEAKAELGEKQEPMNHIRSQAS
jgi:hypothetical protein